MDCSFFRNIFYTFPCSDCNTNAQKQKQKGMEAARLAVELEQARQQINAMQQVTVALPLE
jgi:hypothetical protein